MGSGVLICLFFFFFCFVYLIFYFHNFLSFFFLSLSILVDPSQVQISSSVCQTSYILVHCFPYMLDFLTSFLLSFLSILLRFSFFFLLFFLSTSKSDPEASKANIRHFSQSDPKWQTIDCRQQKNIPFLCKRHNRCLCGNFRFESIPFLCYNPI